MSKNEIAKTWVSGQNSCTLIIEKKLARGVWVKIRPSARCA